MIIFEAKLFCQPQGNDPNAVKFMQNFEFYPQYLYHFRRSDLVQLFGQSPDETIVKHFQLNKQSIANILSMIQPALIAYDVNNLQGDPVFLDSKECLPNRILLLDSFFNVLVWVGSNVAAWRGKGLHLKPEYANVKQLLEAPNDDVEEILGQRFPSPRYDVADQGSSQARILLARVNPSCTLKSQYSDGEVIATDDVGMMEFIDELKRRVLVVEKK